MASGGTPCEVGRSTSGRRTDEQLVFHPSALSSEKPKDGDRRCFKYKPVGILKRLCDVSPGVCELTVEIGDDSDRKKKCHRGTCFLGKFEVRHFPVFGLFTASHVLGEAEIHNPNTKVTIRYPGLEGQQLCRYDLIVQDSPFCFTCPLLDVTFIEFREDWPPMLLTEGFKFLHVYTQWHRPVGTEFHVLHYPGDLNDQVQYFSSGHLEKYNGLHIFHSASTGEGSSGAPVLVKSCDVVAIHTAMSENAKNNYNVAVSATSVFNVLIDEWERAQNSSPVHSCPVTHHPTMDELLSLKSQLTRLGLEMQRARKREDQDEPPRIPFYFTHKELMVTGENDPIPIHFVLTCHGWYWSDLEPDNGAEEPSWTSASTKKFGHGSIHSAKTVVEDRNGFTFNKLQSVGIHNLPKSMFIEPLSNKEMEY